MADRQPYEIARETVKLLTTRKLAPTPENYQTVYHEIAGTKRLQPFPEEQLHAVAKALPAKTPGQQRLAAQVDHAVRHHNWTGFQQAIIAYTQLGPAPRPASELGSAPVPLAASVPMADLNQGLHLSAELCEQLARILEGALPTLDADDKQLMGLGQSLAQELRSPLPNVGSLKTLLANFNFRLTLVAEEQGAVKTTLLELLNLIFQNIGELSLDERWLHGQMEALKTAATPPITLRRLEDVRVRLKDVIFKQIEAKEQTLAAQAEMKRLLAAFIDRLSAMTESSSSFRTRIETCAKKIEGATSLTEIAPVLQEAVTAARSIALDTQRASDELKELREKTQQAEERVAQLESDLERASEQVRHDALTGVLNRKGLDEAVEREIATAKRKGKGLCLALLDIDNFKKLNDAHGHKTGDAALVHLTEVARDCIRPQDSLGRYGGEEFVILMPETTLEQGIEVMTRVQRELTKRFFLAGSEKLLITFSAGVTVLAPEDTGADAVIRADQAMYLAKRTGKNRVVGG